MKIRSIAFAVLTFAVSVSSAWAVPTVIDFDDLSGSSVLVDGYGGIVWNSSWSYFDSGSGAFTPSSPPVAIYASGAGKSTSFQWLSPVVFYGAFVNGGISAGAVSFNLYNGASLVFTSASFSPDGFGTGQFLASGYSGQVDRVEVSGNRSYYLLDDITYDSGSLAPSPAPELNSSAMALPLCFSACLLLALRRRSHCVNSQSERE